MNYQAGVKSEVCRLGRVRILPVRSKAGYRFVHFAHLNCVNKMHRKITERKYTTVVTRGWGIRSGTMTVTTQGNM